VEAHGKEWKSIYGSLLKAFIDMDLFPEDITKSLKKTLLNPAATANGETALLLVLRRYNLQKRAGVVVLANLADGALFKEMKGRTFRKIKVRRKRIECIELATGHIYLFSALTEVAIVNS
jgi:hypothetical protein